MNKIIRLIMCCFIWYYFAANKNDEITVLHEPSHTFSSNGVKEGLYSNYKNNFNDDLSGSIQEYKFKYATKPKLEYNTNTIDRIDNDSFETQVISGNDCLLCNLQ